MKPSAEDDARAVLAEITRKPEWASIGGIVGGLAWGQPRARRALAVLEATGRAERWVDKSLGGRGVLRWRPTLAAIAAARGQTPSGAIPMSPNVVPFTIPVTRRLIVHGLMLACRELARGDEDGAAAVILAAMLPLGDVLPPDQRDLPTDCCHPKTCGWRGPMRECVDDGDGGGACPWCGGDTQEGAP